MTEPEIHGYCIDCGKKYPDERLGRGAWYQSGQPAPCTLCGGVVQYLEESVAEHAISSSQRKRGIGRDDRTVEDEDE